MVIPETPRASEPTDRTDNPRLRLLGIVGAAILILAAIPVLGNLTSVDPESASTVTSMATTTTSIAATSTTFGPIPEMGVPFEWLRIVGLEHPPIAVHVVGSRMLVYGFGPMGRGATVWSGDSIPWGDLVIDTDHEVQSIVATASGLLAVGTEVEGGAPVVWNSVDGIEWRKTTLPTDGLSGFKVAQLAVHASDNLMMVNGYAIPVANFDYSILHAKAESAMRATFGSLLDNFYWEQIGSEVRFDAYGVLGLFLGSSTAAQLGLDPNDFMVSEESYIEIVWVSTDGVSWSRHLLDSPHNGEIFTGPDGGLWAVGQNGFLTTTDGVGWRRIPTTRIVSRPISWGTAVVAFSQHIGHIVISSDGTNFEIIEGPDGLLLHSDDTPQWYTMAAGPYGLAILITRQTEHPIPAPTVEQTLLKREGNLELWVDDQTLVIRRQGEVVTFVEPWAPGTNLAIDLPAGTITVIHPQTGEDLITVNAAELQALVPTETDEWHDWDPDHVERALLFTPDLANWSVQALPAFFDDRQIQGVHVLGNAVVLITVDRDGYQVLTSFTP